MDLVLEIDSLDESRWGCITENGPDTPVVAYFCHPSREAQLVDMLKQQGIVPNIRREKAGQWVTTR